MKSNGITYLKIDQPTVYGGRFRTPSMLIRYRTNKNGSGGRVAFTKTVIDGLKFEVDDKQEVYATFYQDAIGDPHVSITEHEVNEYSVGFMNRSNNLTRNNLGVTDSICSHLNLTRGDNHEIELKELSANDKGTVFKIVKGKK